jgi:geranylgeranyl diphosphate synthase type I
LHSGFPPELLAAAFRRYNRMRVEVAVGQFLDIAESGRPVGEAEARRISLLKSGTYTVEAPLQVGAILAGAPLEVLSVLARYGTPLGEAFQVRDDLDGLERGELDLDQARPTVLLAKARELAAPAERHVLNLLGTGALTDEDRSRAAEIFRTSGAIEAARDHVRELAEESSAALETGLLEPEAAGALRSLAALIAGG